LRPEPAVRIAGTRPLFFAQSVRVQGAKVRVIHREACGLGHRINEIAALDFRIGVGALNAPIFEVALKHNMNAGFQRNRSPAFALQMGVQ
jgi:hypothetical protein